jgi:hypothetical protein
MDAWGRSVSTNQAPARCVGYKRLGLTRRSIADIWLPANSRHGHEKGLGLVGVVNIHLRRKHDQAG